MLKKIGLGILLAAMTGTASASSLICVIDTFLGKPCPTGRNGGGTPVSAPEIDPASAIAGLTLLVGGLAVLRGGRRSKVEV